MYEERGNSLAKFILLAYLLNLFSGYEIDLRDLIGNHVVVQEI